MERTPTVFLIDDDTDDHEIFSHALERADDSAQCVFATDGILAIEKIKRDESFNPDFIFVDMNMPRMNGQQCLKELKKIDRLRNTPVFMYSTSAEPSVIQEHLQLGATEFIIKPSNINDLTAILGRILKNHFMPLMLLLFLLSMVPGRSLAQTDTVRSAKELKRLSVEELMNVVVTSVSRSPEKLSEVASAIQVVTSEEIKRSGTLRLPGALRLATNLLVSSSGAHDTRISSRGFNGFPISNSSLANKLLVQIDGRSVYTPLFGGVFWDVQNVLLEDVKQVEVISGPGGSLWGANAINGIINVVSKSAKESQGVYVSGASGNQLQDFGAVRYGAHSADTTFFYRIYAQRFDINNSKNLNGFENKDAWNMTQGGFRMDYFPSGNTTFTLQGDMYEGREDETMPTVVNGQNIIGRWNYRYSEKSDLTVQAYFDRTYRNIESQSTVDDLKTYDLDIQHNMSTGSRNKLIWGLGYRIADNELRTETAIITPAQKILQLFSGFVQDQFALVPEKMDLTIGTKVLRNDYTGVEFQPTIRLAYFVNDKNTLWTAVSRAVRTPSRIDSDIASPVDFHSEKVLSYELGYRARPAENLSFSISGYYNQYDDLRSLDTNHTPPPDSYFGNNLDATTYGVEFSAKIIAADWWKIRGGYNWLHEEFTTTSPLTNPLSYLLEAIDPKNQFLVQSLMDVAKHFQVDGTLRYVDLISGGGALPSIPSFITFDLRLAWNYKWLTLSAVGSNLAEKSHGSAGSVSITRSVFGRITCRF